MRTPQQFNDAPSALDRSMELWLRERVGPAHDALIADPARARSLEQVRTRLATEQNAT